MILVTGGTGMLGSHILLQLSTIGIEFKALKRTSSSLKICKSVFTYYKKKPLFDKINWVEGDVNDIQSLILAMQNCTKVIHAAAIISFSPSDVELMRKVNIEGTANIVNVALSLGVKKLGYISSIAALGRNTTNKIVNEECYFTPSKKESNYALTKYYAEQEVWRAREEGVDVIIINPSVILGPGDWDKGSSKIFQKIYNGLKFYTDGSTGYVDVVDVAETMIKLVQSNIKNERFIVNGVNLSYKDAFDQIADCFGKPKSSIKVGFFLKEIAWRTESIFSFFSGKKSLITKETANSAMTNSAFSSRKIKETIRFEFTPFQETVKKYCDWFKEDLR